MSGSRVFGVPPEEVTAAMRNKVKAMSHGLAYGLSAFGLSKQLTISTEEARTLMDEYFQRFGGVRDYLHEVVAEARATGYTATSPRPAALPARPDLGQPTAPGDGRADGPQRPDPGLGRGHHQGRDARRRPGTARRGDAPRMLLSGPRRAGRRGRAGEREAVEALVRREMGAAVELDVPLDVSVGHGRSWHDAGH